MKRLIFPVLACLATLSAQPQPPVNPSDDPVVAVIEGQPWKKSELERMVRSLGANISRNYYADKRAFLKTYALMTKLANMAQAEGLDKQDPHLYRIAYNRMLYLAQSRADAQNSRFTIMPEDQKKYFGEHQSDYASARVRVIYLTFNDNPMKSDDPKAKRPRTSAEATKLANDIVTQARAGADFTQLVQKHSDDADSKAKNGEFPPIKPNDTTLPAPIKSAIFALKPGQVSDAIRQTGGFWIFRMEEFVTPAYDDVKDEIFKAIQEARFRQWMEQTQKSAGVEFKDDKYLDSKEPANMPPQPPSPARPPATAK
ncbi:MAG: peptidylprolyl isomerase [Acidobacteria bacterium]|nr:peptidylprolyl isomerase [Acidobacteriota bacterium]